MKPTDQLVAEHVNILRLLDVIDALADQAERGTPQVEAMARAVELVRQYADALHHGKEEQLLFPRLEQNGLPRQMGPIGCMLHEHEEGRRYVAGMQAGIDGLRAGRAEAGDEFARAAAGYVGLLRDHIMKENEVLFPMAEDLLSDADRSELLADFDRVEQVDIGQQQVASMLADLDALSQQLLGQPR